jgi:hypothetical protein
MEKKRYRKEIVIYQAKSGAIEFKGDFGKETIWATFKKYISNRRIKTGFSCKEFLYNCFR